MTIKTHLKRTLAGALTLLLCCAAVLAFTGPAYAWEDPEPRTVRIPYGFNAMLWLDENGAPQGHCAEYLAKLAEVNNWQYEYVQTDWNQAMEMLSRGELDLIFPTDYTAQRSQTMDFSTMVGGYTAPGLFARSDSGYTYDDFAVFDGARIGMTQDSSNELALAAFAQTHNFTYETVYLNTAEEKSQALASGQVDMVVFGASNDLPDTVLVSVLQANPFYFAVQKGNAGLLTELDQGMEYLLRSDPDLVSDTYRRCLLGDNGSILAFTREEKAFVNSGQDVVVGFYDDTRPLGYVDQNSAPAGVYVDLLTYMAESSGLNFTLKPVNPELNWQDLLRDGTLDFFIGVSSPQASQHPDFITTGTFLSYDHVLVTRSDCAFSQLEAPVIALTNGRSYLSDYVFDTFRASEVRYYTSAKDCLLAVMAGQVDATVLNSVEYNYQSKNARFATLIQQENYRVSTAGGLIAKVDADPAMFSAVDKVTYLLTDEYVSTTISDNLNMPYNSTFADQLYIFRYQLLALGVVLLSALVIGLVIWRNQRRNQQADRVQRQLLQDALDQAKRASNAKTDFLSKMSHDIRTPMNAIIGMTAIAGAHLDDPVRVQDALGKISTASHYLLGLINEVLDMSKIESGTITLGEEAFSLSDLLNNLLLMVQPLIKQGGHQLEVRIQDIRHEDVLGDSLRIQQAFVNIMGNAVKYTPDGGKISLFVRELSQPNPKMAGYEFTFQDNGIGMSKEYLEHIFEPFSRAEDVRVSKIQGTGLGMTITQNIVQQMGGSIQVESEEGKGSTFIVTIFLKLQESQELDASELAGLPVLVVDDDPDARASVCELLNQISMRATPCATGQEAVERVEKTMDTPEQFYATIVDWKMPGMDGVETARTIRQVAGDRIPVIILSAYDCSDLEPEARAAGVTAFLSKPVFKSGLIRQLKALQTAAPDSQAQLQGFQESDYTGSRVLLVEDNDLNREIARELFEMAGLEVEDAENGQIAVDKFMASDSGYYRMIFMDVQMPVMTGHEATRAIRALDRPDAADIPIVAMTANAFAEDVQASKAAGMNEHLAKPIDFDKLSAILKKYLG